MPYVMRHPTRSGGPVGGGDGFTAFKLWHFNTDGFSTDAVDEFEIGGGGGNVTIDTVDFKFGPGSVDLGLVGMTDDIAIGSIFSGSWTFEFWGRINAGSTLRQLMSASGGSEVIDIISGDGAPGVITWEITDVTGTRATAPTIDDDIWYHWALVRDVVAGTYSLYFNGNRIDQVSSAADVTPGSGNVWTVGMSGANCGYDEVRFTAAAVYSGATYTLPTSEFL